MCSPYAGCGHFVPALGPSALGWRKMRSLLYLIFVELPFYNTYTSYVVDNIIFEISVPEYPCITVKTHFWGNLEVCYFLVVNTTNIYHTLLTISYLESVYPITSVEPLKPRFWDKIEICLLLGRKQQQIFITCFDNIIFGVSVPITPVKPLKPCF